MMAAIAFESGTRRSLPVDRVPATNCLGGVGHPTAQKVAQIAKSNVSRLFETTYALSATSFMAVAQTLDSLPSSKQLALLAKVSRTAVPSCFIKPDWTGLSSVEEAGSKPRLQTQSMRRVSGSSEDSMLAKRLVNNKMRDTKGLESRALCRYFCTSDLRGGIVFPLLLCALSITVVGGPIQY